MAISVGFEHMLSIDYDGNVAIWGKVIDDNGAFTVYDRANGVVAGETVTGLASLGDISLIATGKNFSVAMSNSGNIAAWGIGDYGEIGNSGFSSFNYPVYTGEKSAENYRFEIGQITTNQGDIKEDYDGSSEFFLAPSKITISQKEKYVVNPTRAIRTVHPGFSLTEYVEVQREHDASSEVTFVSDNENIVRVNGTEFVPSGQYGSTTVRAVNTAGKTVWTGIIDVYVDGRIAAPKVYAGKNFSVALQVSGKVYGRKYSESAW